MIRLQIKFLNWLILYFVEPFRRHSQELRRLGFTRRVMRKSVSDGMVEIFGLEAAGTFCDQNANTLREARRCCDGRRAILLFNSKIGLFGRF